MERIKMHFDNNEMGYRNDQFDNIIIRAHYLCIAFHQGQTRKFPKDGSIPYHTHPIAVAKMVRDHLKNQAWRDDREEHYSVHFPQETIAAAYLHDVLEDVEEIGSRELIRALGPSQGWRVVDYVEELTNVPKSFGNRKKRKEEMYGRLREASQSAKLIKAYDRIHNLTDGLVESDPKFAMVYLEESRKLLDAISHGASKGVRHVLSDLENTIIESEKTLWKIKEMERSLIEESKKHEKEPRGLRVSGRSKS